MLFWLFDHKVPFIERGNYLLTYIYAGERERERDFSEYGDDQDDRIGHYLMHKEAIQN